MVGRAESSEGLFASISGIWAGGWLEELRDGLAFVSSCCLSTGWFGLFHGMEISGV